MFSLPWAMTALCDIIDTEAAQYYFYNVNRNGNGTRKPPLPQRRLLVRRRHPQTVK